MEDFGNIIYLLLLIGVSIIGSISKTIKANREQKRMAKQVEEHSTDDVEVDFDDLQESESRTEPVFEQPMPKPIEPVYAAYQEPHSIPVQPSVRQHQSPLHHASHREKPVDCEVDAGVGVPDLSTPESARAAFIASEIFNRRY